MSCLAFNHNVTIDENGNSKWFDFYGKHFDESKAFPYGCGVWFGPAPTKSYMSKQAPRLRFGVFAGYKVQPGPKWEGEYLL